MFAAITNNSKFGWPNRVKASFLAQYHGGAWSAVCFYSEVKEFWARLLASSLLPSVLVCSGHWAECSAPQGGWLEQNYVKQGWHQGWVEGRAIYFCRSWAWSVAWTSFSAVFDLICNSSFLCLCLGPTICPVLPVFKTGSHCVVLAGPELAG